MKLFSLSANETKDNHAIQRRASIIIVSAIIANSQTGGFTSDSNFSQDVEPNYEENQVQILKVLNDVIINTKLSGKKTTDLIKNFSATEIMKISQTLGFPVLVKSTDVGLKVSFVLPLTLDRSSIPFSSTNTLYLSIKNRDAQKIDVYSVDSSITSTNSILRYEREILQAGQRKDYLNTDSNYVTSVLETIHETDVYYENGEVSQYLPDEFDVLNDFNARCQLVWNNEQHSNFGNMTSIPMFGVRKIAVQGTDTDQNVFFVRNVNLQ